MLFFTLLKVVHSTIQFNLQNLTITEVSAIVYVSRVLNDIQGLFPLIVLIAKLNDPFTIKLFKISVKEIPNTDKTKRMSLSDSLIISHDFTGYNEVQTTREKMLRSFVVGLNQYYSQWIDVYHEQENLEILNKLVNLLRHTTIVNQADIQNGEAKAGLECEIVSQNGPYFWSIIQNFLILDIQKSFNFAESEDLIENQKTQISVNELEFDFLTWDRRFQIKSISENEYQTLALSTAQYSTFIIENKFSFLSKIIGLFTFKFSYSSKIVRLIVYENVFIDEEKLFKRRYELKGYQMDRQIMVKSTNELSKIKKKKITETLKDIDFTNIDKCFVMKDTDIEFILTNIEKDVSFLKTLNFIDYSLMVGVIEKDDHKAEYASHFEEIVSLKLAFFDFSEKFILIFGITHFFSKNNDWNILKNRLFQKNKKAENKFEMPLDSHSYAEQFIKSIKENFKI